MMEMNNYKIEEKTINRVLIAGTHSGCGKTSITCGILRALQKRSKSVHAFKCGPDYIDPMFHTEVVGTPSRNIDMFLCSREVVKSLFAENSEEDKDSLSVVEGVMGYYDGMGGNSTVNSTYDISMELDIPTILVVDCKGASISSVAMIQGYQNYRANKIKAVILNRVSKAMLPLYQEVIEKETGLEVLGCMPNDARTTIGSRHLGLITAEEIQDLDKRIDILAELVEEHIDIERFLAIAGEASPFMYMKNIPRCCEEKKIRIAWARDKAFCFYYEDGLKTLEDLGVELVSFSPMSQEQLPENIDGIILGGGYPELYLETLSENKSMLLSIKMAHEDGIPIYAECGGFMYLGNAIDEYPMCGIIDMKSEMTTRLQNFGYATLTPIEEGGLTEVSIHGHEFHYSKSDLDKFAYCAKKSTGKAWKVGYCKGNVFAQYSHIHFSGEITFARNFVDRCRRYQECKVGKAR